MVEAFLFDKQIREKKKEENNDDNSGCGPYVAGVIIVVVGFWFLNEIDLTTKYLTWRLNVRFGTEATDFWETSYALIALVELEYLISPAVTRLEMKADPENYRGYKAFIELAEHWNRELKTRKGKKALEKADDEVEENFETCLDIARRVKKMLGE